MAKAIFIMERPFIDYIPPMDNDFEGGEDGVCIHYMEDSEIRGGYWMLSPPESPSNADAIFVISSEETVQEMGSMEGVISWARVE